MYKVVTFALFISTCVAAQTPRAELPRTYINTTWTQTSGRQWPVHTSGEFNNALTAAQPGDVIVLDAGVAYIGNFNLPAKSNPTHKWIYIQSSGLGKLPVPGSRVTPADALNMPKIVTPNASNAFTLASGSGYVRFIGIEMYSVSTYLANPSHTPHPINGFSYYLLYGSGVTNITVDRSYLHGSNTQDVNHAFGVSSNSSYIAVIDSDIRDIHGGTNDSQAFLAFSSPGPFKVVNNYLSATGQEVMFGGAGGYSSPYVMADIEVRNNHFYKPPEWTAQTIAPGQQWIVKNNFECKSCLRVVMTGNVLENAWYSGDQVGGNIVLTPRPNQSGYNSVVDDITIDSNILKNANQAVSLLGYDNNCTPPSCIVKGEEKRVVIKNNLILTRDPAAVGSYHPLGFSVLHGMDGVLIQHNTVEGVNGSQSWASIYFNDAVSPDHPTNVYILDNVFDRQPTGDGSYQGQAALDRYMPLPAPNGSRFVGNVMFVPGSDRVTSWPVHNYASTVPLAFLSPPSGNYQLVTPTWLDTSDGKVAGVDATMLNLQINPVARPLPRSVH